MSGGFCLGGFFFCPGAFCRWAFDLYSIVIYSVNLFQKEVPLSLTVKQLGNAIRKLGPTTANDDSYRDLLAKLPFRRSWNYGLDTARAQVSKVLLLSKYVNLFKYFEQILNFDKFRLVFLKIISLNL